jgi:glycosyltransferase involved in cell wall biosynthesis
MAGKPSALVLCPESPYPPVGGGPLRTASVIDYLSNRYDVELMIFQEDGAEAPPGATTIPLRQHKKTTAARVARNLSRAVRGVPPLNDRFAGYTLPSGRSYKLALFEHFWCAGYIGSVAAEKTWLDLHNIESAFYRSTASGLAAPLMRRFSESALRLERELLPKFTGILVTSEADGERVRRIAPGCQTVVYPNAIPLTPQPEVPKRREIVFSGNLEYEPNRQAVRYFRQTIWPALRKAGVRWRVLGKNPQAVARMLDGDPQIELTGPVDDAVREIAAALVAVVPLLAGSGTRIKIIEAWAAGTPVVSTTIGAEGLPAVSGEHLLLADGPERFIGSVEKLLHDQASADKIACNARKLYEREFTWPAAHRKLSVAGL